MQLQPTLLPQYRHHHQHHAPPLPALMQQQLSQELLPLRQHQHQHVCCVWACSRTDMSQQHPAAVQVRLLMTHWQWRQTPAQSPRQAASGPCRQHSWTAPLVACGTAHSTVYVHAATCQPLTLLAHSAATNPRLETQAHSSLTQGHCMMTFLRALSTRQRSSSQGSSGRRSTSRRARHCTHVPCQITPQQQQQQRQHQHKRLRCPLLPLLNAAALPQHQRLHALC